MSPNVMYMYQMTKQVELNLKPSIDSRINGLPQLDKENNYSVHSQASTIEQVLSYNDNHHLAAPSGSKTLSTEDENDVTKQNESKSPHSYYQNYTFNDIIESTHVDQTVNYEQPEDANNVDFHAPVMNYSDETSTKSANGGFRRRSVKEIEIQLENGEDASKWVKSECAEEPDQSKWLIKFESSLLKKGNRVRVRLVVNSNDKSNSEYLVFQILDMQGHYERLQSAMATFYKKMAEASRSLEKNSSSENISNDLSDSVKSTESNDLFLPTYAIGSFCAAYMSVSKTWCRCVITDIVSDRKAYIESVDDDQKQWIPLSKLEKLNDNFKLMHKFAFKAKLNDKVMSQLMSQGLIRSINDFKKFILEKQKESKDELVAEILDVVEISDDQNLMKQRVCEIDLRSTGHKNKSF